MKPTQYPLTWPAGWKRIQSPERSRFERGSPSAEANEIRRELGLLGATGMIISSNLEYKPDGMPYARQTRLHDTGVAVYFTLHGKDQCIPCDKWISVEENLRAVWKTVAALRALDRWGAKDMVAAAFRGFAALPESIIVSAGTARAWWEVLNIPQDASEEYITSVYRTLAKSRHPDHGGTQKEFEELRKAYKEAIT